NRDAEYISNKKSSSDPDKIMLIRKRKSRIFYQKKFFDYPLRLNAQTFRNLGIVKMGKIGFSYLFAKLAPHRKEETLEQFFKNRFGNELYLTFFKDYTEKVWGVPCSEIPAAWGQQRVKNLNIGKVIGHALRSAFTSDKSIQQKETATSLIEQFLYPKYGPGQLWETVGDEIIKRGGIILYNTIVTGLTGNGIDELSSVQMRNHITGEIKSIAADYVLSTMPVKDLAKGLTNMQVPAEVIKTASALQYRDFLITGILTTDLTIKDKDNAPVTDNWIYIQDKNVKAGRLQLFHNWSPYMINQQGYSWIGVEYFCNETDTFWQSDDSTIINKVIEEMETIGILKKETVKGAVVIRVKKAYPSYYGAYENFSIIKEYFDTIKNLFLIGRNGMHRYNNSDHSMLTAMAAVENIIEGNSDKSAIWQINTDDEYHEEE
ncbi:MAG: hypothetical protein JST09_14965, partial [Bacteroidetes bacterium]|nr:hypothetical protein [Bacteroidota bacterium]